MSNLIKPLLFGCQMVVGFVSIFFILLPAHAQYGNEIVSGFPNIDYPDEPIESVNEISGEAGDEFVLDPVAGISGSKVKLVNDVVDGEITVIVTVISKHVDNVPDGTILNAYYFKFDNVEKDDVVIDVIFKVNQSRLETFDVTQVYTFNENGQKVPVNTEYVDCNCDDEEFFAVEVTNTCGVFSMAERTGGETGIRLALKKNVKPITFSFVVGLIVWSSFKIFI